VRNIKNLLTFIAETRQLRPSIQSLKDGANFSIVKKKSSSHRSCHPGTCEMKWYQKGKGSLEASFTISRAV